MAGGEVVRKPLHAGERSSRTLGERLFLRFPWLAAASARLIGRLPLGSRVRESAVWRSARLAVDAYNRRDLDAVVIGCHPGFEYVPARSLVDAGLMEPSYRGLDGYREYVAATTEVWGSETRLVPSELIDLGDRGVMLATAPMRAQGSGVPLTLTFGLVSRLSDGRVTRFEEYHDHDEALRAVGL